MPYQESITINIMPIDHRRPHWAKKICCGAILPIPALITGANSLPGPFLKNGNYTLSPGEFIIEAHANHRTKYRGWVYRLHGLSSTHDIILIEGSEFSRMKRQLRKAGLSADLLAGSGEVTAAVRLIHASYAGLDIARIHESLAETASA